MEKNIKLRLVETNNTTDFNRDPNKGILEIKPVHAGIQI